MWLALTIRWIGWSAALIGITLLPAYAQSGGRGRTAEQLDEIRVQAAFLFNFAKFSQWPDKALASPAKKFCVGVIGDELLAETLREVTAGRTVRGLSVTVVDARRAEDLRSCHIAFIGAAERRRYPAHIRALNGLPVLTVSTGEGFLDQGGMVELFLKDNRMRFCVARNALETGGLRISAELQALASSR